MLSVLHGAESWLNEFSFGCWPMDWFVSVVDGEQVQPHEHLSFVVRNSRNTAKSRSFSKAWNRKWNEKWEIKDWNFVPIRSKDVARRKTFHLHSEVSVFFFLSYSFQCAAAESIIDAHCAATVFIVSWWDITMLSPLHNIRLLMISSAAQHWLYYITRSAKTSSNLNQHQDWFALFFFLTTCDITWPILKPHPLHLRHTLLARSSSVEVNEECFNFISVK